MFACPMMCKWVTVYQQKDITHQYQKLFNRISRKRTPTMRKIGGRLQEQNHRGLFRQEVRTQLFYGR